MPLVEIVSRVVHILCAVTLGGGLFYLCAVQAPALAETDDATRERVGGAARRHWARLVMVTALFLLLSGSYNYYLAIQASRSGAVELAKFYHPLMGIKILLALTVIFLASLLSGRSPAAVRARENSQRWLTVASLCVVLIVTIAGVLKIAGHMKPKSQAPPASVTQLHAEQS